MKKYEEYRDSSIEWLGEIPSHWKLSKFKHIVKYNNSGEVIDKSFWNEGNELLFTCSKTPIKSSYSEFPNRKRTVSRDILLTRNGTPYVFIPPINSIYSNVVQRVILNEDVDIKFTKYMLETSSTTLLGNGDIIASFNMDLWSNLNILIPPLQEQQQIASYLDCKTSKMDELISKKEELIETLKNARRKLISETVTKGLDKDVKMKDSGVEWIGEIPEHWNCVCVNTLFTFRNEKVSDKDYQPLSVTKNGVVLQLDNVAKTDNGDNRKLVRINDFVINSRADRKGSCGYSKYTGSVSVINHVLKPLDDINIIYYHYLFKSNIFSEEFFRWGRGIVDDLWTTRTDEFKKIQIPFPNLKEQQQIASYLGQETSKIDELILKTEKQIEMLKKAKQSLITEVVTGKIDVRGWTK